MFFSRVLLALICRLIPWFATAPAVAQSVALNMIGSVSVNISLFALWLSLNVSPTRRPLACAVVDASPHLAQFVRHYVDTPLARPLILAALAAKWRLSGNNDDAPQVGSVLFALARVETLC